MINSKEDLVNKIKEMAKDLESRAEDIAVDWNKQIKRINFYSNIAPDEITEWDVTKEYLVFPREINIELHYDKEKTSKMLEMGFDDVSCPAKLIINDKEYLCLVKIDIPVKRKTIMLRKINLDIDAFEYVIKNVIKIGNEKYYWSVYNYEIGSNKNQVFINYMNLIQQ